MRSAKQAGFFEMAADRLTKPAIRVESNHTDDKKGNPENEQKKSGGGGNGGSDHPLIQGLLLTLPKPGDEWTYEDRFNWLNMANSIFKMVYKSSGSTSDVEVKLTQKP